MAQQNDSCWDPNRSFFLSSAQKKKLTEQHDKLSKVKHVEFYKSVVRTEYDRIVSN